MIRAHQRPLAVLVLTLVVFVLLACQVVLGGDLVAVIDPAVTHGLAGQRRPELTRFLVLVTQAHSTLGIDLMLAIAAVLVYGVGKDWRRAVWLVVAVESSMMLNVALKNAFARHRPDADAPLVHLATYSFPSGHALASTVFWACVWLLLPAGKAKAFAAAGLAFMVLLVCVSRVYLGAHFLTDVVAGVSEGLFCAAGWSLLLAQLRARSASGTACGSG